MSLTTKGNTKKPSSSVFCCRTPATAEKCKRRAFEKWHPSTAPFSKSDEFRHFREQFLHLLIHNAFSSSRLKYWIESTLHLQMIHLSFENVCVHVYENCWKKGLWRSRIEKTSLHMLYVTAHWIPHVGGGLLSQKTCSFFLLSSPPLEHTK